MDVGAMTVFLYCYEEREKIHNFYEQLTGARFTSSYTRIGGPDARRAAANAEGSARLLRPGGKDR